jgi:O-antigen/teichoic acid export membrane protein
VLAAPLTKSLTTAEFLGGSSGVVAIIALSNIIFGLYSISSKTLFLVKKPIHVAAAMIFSAVLNITLNIVLIPSMGLFGAALATLLSFSVLLTITLLLSKRHITLLPDFIFLGKCVLAALAMGVFVNLISPKGIVNMIIVAIFAALIYFAILFVMRAFRKNEIQFFKSFLKRQEQLTDPE